MHARAQFPPEPRSASRARRWVREHLREIGRDDLIPAAEAGVSELVTNGILHAHTPIGLQVTHRRGHLVIEVFDGSPMDAQPTLDTATPTPLESTIGRGLRLVRANAREWGVATTPRGKVIWFQPLAPNGSGGHDEKQFSANGVHHASDDEPDFAADFEAVLGELASMFPDDIEHAEDVVQVRLVGVPLRLIRHYRKRWLELVREMNLVAAGEPSAEQEIAYRFCAAERALHNDLYVVERSAGGYAPAVDVESSTIDALFDVYRTTRQQFVDMRDMARELERSWAGNRLLLIHPGPQVAQLREWWLGEFIAQIDGAEPTAWHGEHEVHDRSFSGGEL